MQKQGHYRATDGRNMVKMPLENEAERAPEIYRFHKPANR